MNTLKEKLLTNWDLMRVFRLVIGAWMVVQAVMQREMFIGLFGAFFLYQAVTGTGCCGTQACYAPPTKSKGDITQDIEYEEVK